MTQTKSNSKAMWILAPIVFLCALVLYVWTMPGAAGWGDGADFVLCAKFLGVAHPTGYPLVTLLGRAFLETPAGDDAFRMALLSVFAGAGAVVVFFMVASRFSNIFVAIYSTAILAVSTFLWKQAVSVEVYTINLFFFMCMMAVALGRGNSFRLLVAVTGVAVLGLGNHGTLVFPAVLAALWLLGKTGRRIIPAAIVCTFLVFLGFTMYISIPVFSARTNVFDWNMVDNAAKLSALVSGLDFWVIGEYRTDIMAANASILGASVFRQVLPLLLIGIVAWFASCGKMAGGKILLPGIFLLSAFFPVLYPTLEKEAFFLVAFSVLLLMGSGGFSKILPGKPAVLAAIVVFAVCHICYTGVTNYKTQGILSVKADDTAEKYTAELFKSTRRDALIYVDHVADDTIAPPLYFQFDQYMRRDVFVFHRLYLAFPWYREYMRQRAVETGDMLAVPIIDMEAEKRKKYKISEEEKQRMEEGKTLNTVSIDIQTVKFYEANKDARPQYLNTPARFRMSVLSEEISMDTDGFAFRMNGGKLKGAVAPPVPPSGGIMDEIEFDYLSEAAFSAHRKNDIKAFTQLLEKASVYSDKGWLHGELAGAYLVLGDNEKAEHHRRIYEESRAYNDFN